MEAHRIRITPEALADLDGIMRYVRARSGSIKVADTYLSCIERFLLGLQYFPERGTIRNDTRPGLRVIGFERTISVAFVVEADEVIILRVLAGGRQGFAEIPGD